MQMAWYVTIEVIKKPRKLLMLHTPLPLWPHCLPSFILSQLFRFIWTTDFTPACQGNNDDSRIILASEFFSEWKDSGSSMLRIRWTPCEVDYFIIGQNRTYTIWDRYTERPLRTLLSKNKFVELGLFWALKILTFQQFCSNFRLRGNPKRFEFTVP